MKGKGLTALEETPELLRATNATQILSEVRPTGWLAGGTTGIRCFLTMPDRILKDQGQTFVAA